jgi:hypothetical protein
VASAGAVEMMIELTAKFDEATKLLREMTKVEAESARLAASLAKAGKSTSLLTDGMSRVKGSFKAVGGGVFEEFGKGFSANVMGQFTALAGFEGFKRLGDKLFELGKEGLEAAGGAERTRKSFEYLMGVEPAEQMLGFMDKLANKTEFTGGTLKGFASQLTKAGFSGAELNRAMAATIDLAALSQNKLEGAGSAISLLSKVQLKGGVSEREIISAGLSPKKIFERIGAELGIGVDAVDKRLQAGKVKTGVILGALYGELTAKTGKGALGAAGIAMGDTFLAKIEKTKDIIPNLFEGLDSGGGLDRVTSSLDRLVSAFDPASPSGQKIVSGLQGMLTNFGQMTQKIDFNVWADRLVMAMEIIEGVAWLIGGILTDVGKVFDKLTGLGTWMGDTAFDAAQGFKGWFGLGEGSGEAFNQGLRSRAPGAQLAGGAVGGAGGVGLKRELKIESPSRVFTEYGVQSGKGFGIGIQKSLPGVTDTVAEAFSPGTLLPAVPVSVPLGSIPVGGAPAGAAAVGGAVGPRLQANITINVGGDGGHSGGSSKEQADEIAVSLRQALESLLAQMAAEGGGS